MKWNLLFSGNTTIISSVSNKVNSFKGSRFKQKILSFPGFLEACVVEVAHPKWEERPLALVVLREGFKSVKREE